MSAPIITASRSSDATGRKGTAQDENRCQNQPHGTAEGQRDQGRGRWPDIGSSRDGEVEICVQSGSKTFVNDRTDGAVGTIDQDQGGYQQKTPARVMARGLASK